MKWGINFYLIFLLCYTNGQIKQVPIDQQQNENGINKLKGVASEVGGAFSLKGKKQHGLTAQWERDSEALSRWPNGEIRYYVDPSSYDTNIKSLLEAAFAQLSSLNDCPNFGPLDSKPQETGSPWLHFTNPNRERDCVHDLGQNRNGEIVVTLGYDCLKPAQVLHTVLHGLGFHDEVTHPQRDLFVRIQWGNIQPAFRSMFRIQPAKTGALLDYDPKSVMHFHDRAYTVNGQATIASLLPGLTVEPSDELSHLDKMKIRLAFGHECKKRQIDKILNRCGRGQNKFDDGDKYEKIIVPGKDVTDITPDNERVNPEGDADLIVIPGTNVKPDGNESDGDADLIVPGANVKLEDDQDLTSGNDDAEERPDGEYDGDADLIVPGADVNPEDDQELTSALDDAEVRPGKNEDDKGNLLSGSDDVVIPGSNVELGSDKVTDNEVKSEELNDGEVDKDEREPGIVITGNNVDTGKHFDSGNNVDLASQSEHGTGFDKERGVVITGNNADIGSEDTLRGEKYRA